MRASDCSKGFALAAAIALLCSGCAPPVSQYRDQTFVPKIDLVGVSLAKEGGMLAAQGRYQDAELKYRSSLRLFPEAQNIQENLALVLVETQQYREAQDILSALQKAWPARLRYRTALAKLKLREGDYEQAIKFYVEVFEAALEKNDSAAAADAARNLAVVFYSIGLEESAFCFSEQALALRPDPLERERHLRLLNSLQYHQDVLAFVENWSETEGIDKLSSGILWQYALALAGIERYQDSIDVMQILTDRPQIDQATSLDIDLARQLISAYVPEVVVKPKSKKELEDEEHQDPDTTAALLPAALSSTDRLYWPADLLEFFQRSYPQSDQADGSKR